MLKRTLRSPQYADTVLFSPNFDPFHIPHLSITQAEAHITQALTDLRCLVFFSEIELRIFNTANLGQASLLSCYPRLPSRTRHYFGSPAQLKDAMDMCLLEGLLVLNVPLFLTSQMEWNAADDFFESAQVPDSFPHPLLPLYRMGRLSLKDRLLHTLKHFT
jgi:hypothetical protein